MTSQQKRDQKIRERRDRLVERVAERDKQGQLDQLMTLPGVNVEIAEALYNADLISLDDVGRADDDRLLSISGIGPVTLKRIREHLGELF